MLGVSVHVSFYVILMVQAWHQTNHNKRMADSNKDVKVARDGCRRWVLFILSFVIVSSVSGVVFGWPALRRQLTNVEKSSLDEKTLGAVFTIGSWSTYGLRLLFGLARDRYGTKLTACTSIVCVMVGFLGVAFSHPNNAVGLAISIMAMGLGSGAQLCALPVAALFGRNSGTVMSSLSGAFQVSGLVFVVLTTLPTSRKIAFSGFAAALFMLLCVSAYTLPMSSSYLKNEPFPPQDDDDGDDYDDDDDEFEANPMRTTMSEAGNSRSPTATPPQDVDEKNFQREQNSDPTTPNLPNSSPSTTSRQLWSREYMALVAWFSVSLIPMQYYVATIGFHLENKGDTSGFYTSLFSILFASAAILTPFGGSLADSCGLGAAQALATVGMAISMFILASDNIGLKGQALGMAVYGLARGLTFGMFFTNIGKRFGYSNYGILSGIGFLIAGIVSLFQYALIAWTVDGNEKIVNAGCGVGLILLLPYCCWLGQQERRGNPVLPPPSSTDKAKNTQTPAS